MSEKKSNNKFFLGLTVAALLPLSFYLVTAQLSKGKVQMPGHYIADRTNPDTVWHTVADLTLTNQTGNVVSLNKDLGNRILVVDFIFTHCTTTCPKLSQHMKLLQTGFRKDPKKEASLDTIVQFVTITVDPARDSFPALRAYADKYGANHDHWWFLTGDKATIYNFARNELGLSTGAGDGGAEDFIHTDKLVLIDKDRHIRGYYNGIDISDIRKCADDIVLLTLEKKKKK